MNVVTSRFVIRAAVLCALAAPRYSGLLAQNSATPTEDQPYRVGKMVISSGGTLLDLATTRLDSEAFRNTQISSPRDFTAVAPNLTSFDANGDRIPRFSLRGLRENNFSYGESAVAIYVDDVPYNDLWSRSISLYGIQSGEFLRGPQGTLYGASRPGGVINLLTDLPSNELRGRGLFRYGNYNAVTLDAGVSGPVVKDHLFVGVSGLYQRRDGYFENLLTGGHPDDRDALAGRLQVRWVPTETLDFTFTGSIERFRDGTVVSRPIAAPGDIFDLKMDQSGSNQMDSHTYSLRGAWTGTWAKLISVTTRRDWRQELHGDFDYAEYFSPVAVPIPALTGYTSPDLGQWTQELRLQSLEDATRNIRWNAGAFFSDRTVETDLGQIFGPAAALVFQAPIPAGVTDNTYFRDSARDLALFGSGTYTFREKLDVTAGLRLESEQREIKRRHTNPLAPPPYNDLAYEASHDFNSVQPRAAIAYRFCPAATGWFSAASGFQPGGFSPSQDNPAKARYDAAESQHYEVGLSTRFLDGKLLASALGYMIATDDYQVYRPVPNRNGLDYQVLNAHRAIATGAELDLSWKPCKYFDWTTALGYTHAEFDKFTDPNGVNFDGNTINFVPEFTVSSTITVRHDCGGYASVGVTGIGAYWFDEANTVKQPAYALLNARIGFDYKKVGIALFGRNLLDKKYYANALDLGPRANAPRGFFVGTPGDPMIFGVELTGRF
ncbi:MAG: hypothetical protein EXS36_13720 [Pedosphaera sp.]|nr:hypothetical protein [Pedosphaera sp.]